MPSNGSLKSLSVADLNREIAKRRSALPRLQRRRESLARQLATIDREIADLGGVRTAGNGSKRPRNEMNLADSLAAALKGQTMSVTEVAEEVQRRGYVTTSPKNFRTMVNQTLINSGMFKRVGRGQYTAK